MATKFGIRYEDGQYSYCGDPAYVRAACEARLKRLDVDCIDLYYQHRIDTQTPIEVTVISPSLLPSLQMLLLFTNRFFYLSTVSIKFYFLSLLSYCMVSYFCFVKTLSQLLNACEHIHV